MSDGFFGRVLNLIRGASESLLNDLERDNPEAVYQAAIEAENQRYQQLQQSIASLSLRRDRLHQDREQARRDIADLGDRAAREAGRDDEKALRLLEQKQVAEEKLADLEQAITTVGEQLEQTRALLPTVKDRLRELKAERDQLLTQLRSAEARNADQELSTGYATNAADRALQNVREKAERLASITGSSTSTPSTPATRADATRTRAQAELEALKKMKAGQPVAPASPSKEDALPRPARTLDVAPPVDAAAEEEEEDDTPEAEDDTPEIPRRTL